MARIAKDVDTLKVYIRGVVVRAECHAPGVKGVVFAVLGAVIWCDGDVLVSFDNDTKAGEIYNFFSCLRVPR